jgi:hypothetical protein
VAKGLLAPPDPAAPGIFALADPDRVRSLVSGTGFASPRLEEVPTHLRFADFDAYWRYLTELAGGISPVLRGLPPEKQAEIRATLRDAAAPFESEGRYDFPGLCLNALTSRT